VAGCDGGLASLSDLIRATSGARETKKPRLRAVFCFESVGGGAQSNSYHKCLKSSANLVMRFHGYRQSYRQRGATLG